jgi:hypothetical protein
MSDQVDFSIAVSGSVAAGFTATVSPQLKSAKKAGYVRWNIDKIPGDFPKKAKIFLQFNDQNKAPVDGPFDGANLTKGRFDAKGKYIGGTISTSGESSDYSLYYDLEGVVKLLTDPELVVEGDSFALVKFMRARKAGLRALLSGKRKRTKKAKKAKKSKKAKKR